MKQKHHHYFKIIDSTHPHVVDMDIIIIIIFFVDVENSHTHM